MARYILNVVDYPDMASGSFVQVASYYEDTKTGDLVVLPPLSPVELGATQDESGRFVLDHSPWVQPLAT